MVVTFLYGALGSFKYGSPQIFNGSYLAESERVMVVNPAYRLGPFGWLPFGDDSVHNNLGLQDQQSALRFVKKFATHFGGDPSRVLLLGEILGVRAM